MFMPSLYTYTHSMPPPPPAPHAHGTRLAVVWQQVSTVHAPAWCEAQKPLYGVFTSETRQVASSSLTNQASSLMMAENRAQMGGLHCHGGVAAALAKPGGGVSRTWAVFDSQASGTCSCLHIAAAGPADFGHARAA